MKTLGNSIGKVFTAVTLIYLLICGVLTGKPMLPNDKANGITLSNSRSVSFKTQDGWFLMAEFGGGHGVLANRKEAHEWEKFTIVDLDGDTLKSGHHVRIQSSGSPRDKQDPQYWQVPNGDFVYANSKDETEKTKFTILKVGGGEAINSFDKIRLQTSDGRLVAATGGDGSPILGNANDDNAKTSLTIVIY